MKIAIVNHHTVKGEGQGRVNFEIARYLLANGVDVDLISHKVSEELIKQGATWVPLHPGITSINLAKVWDFRRKANRIIEGKAYDAVLACGVTLSMPHAVNAVHFVHGTWLRSPYHSSKSRPGIRGSYHWLYTFMNARWERQTLAQADTVVAVSPMVRDELIQVGIPAKKIEVVVNGVDVNEFKPGHVNRQALGLPEDTLLGLFVGDLQSPIKNLDGVLRALADVGGVHLAVAGSVSGSPYPKLAKRLGVDERVCFLGFRRDINKLMRAADFFTLPSRRDSCPLVLLEAMASGLPVITSRQVGNSHLVSDSGSGFVLTNPDDHEALCQALLTLRDAPKTRSEMGRSARQEVERHSWKKMADRYYTILRAAACLPSSPSSFRTS